MDIQNEYAQILEHNKEYAAQQIAKDPNFFKNLSTGQKPTFLLIGCSDSRVPPEQITETSPGDVFVCRNIANQVLTADFNIQGVVQYAVDHLHVPHIIVMGHTGCGGIAAAYDRGLQGGMLDMWLAGIRGTMQEHQHHMEKLKSDEEKLLYLTKQNVRDQVHNLWKNVYVQKALHDGAPVWVHGWVFHVDTGLIEDIMLEKEIPHDLKEVFGLKFQ